MEDRGKDRSVGGGVFFPNDFWPAGGGAISIGGALGCGTAVGSRTRIWNCTIYGNEVHSLGSLSRRGAGIWSGSGASYPVKDPPFEPSFEEATGPIGAWLAIANTIVRGNRTAAILTDPETGELYLEYDSSSLACPSGPSELGSIEECITRLGLSNPEALAACIEAMILNETP